MANPQPSQIRKVKGSVPCGNPQRFTSREVIQMTHGSRKRTHGEDEDVKTEGEKHIQNLVKQQINTDVSITGQFSQHRTFTPASSHDPAVDQLTGLHQYGHYKQVEELDARVDELRHYGLSDEEIVLKMKQDFKEQITERERGFGADPTVENQRLQDIECKIAEKEALLQKEDTFKGALTLSRQERDLERSIAQRYGKESVLPKSLTAPKKFADSHPDDPINNISDILRKVEGKTTREPRRERRRRRKIERRREYYSQFEHSENEDKKSSESDEESNSSEFIGDLSKECYSNGDGQSENSQNVDSSGQETFDNNISTSPNGLCHSSNDTHIDRLCVGSLSSHEVISKPGSTSDSKRDSVKHVVTTTVTFIPEEDILKNRLSTEDIRNLEKFKNYDRGLPNKIIYVKNLPNRTTEEDLISLFGQFQSDKPEAPDIVYKLLTGRMKGQAFVTFPDESVAEKALDTVNGYILRERPIILCFGKKQV